MKPEEFEISADKFEFAQNDGNLRDKELVTKPIGYFKDAWNRFRKNKASIVAAIIILVLVLFAIFAPFTTPYKVASEDSYLKFCLPKSHLSAATGWDFWDGCENVSYNKENFYYYYSMGVETGHNAVKNQKYTIEKVKKGNVTTTYYNFRFDTYQKNGVIFMNLSSSQYQDIQRYQNETGIQIFYPITDVTKRPTAIKDENDANYWFETTESGGKSLVKLDTKGNFVNIYEPYSGTDDYNSIRIKGDNNLYDYAIKNQTGYQVRINYYEYYIYYHTQVLKDGISTPIFVFGSTNAGKDILTCLASGARFSFILAIVVSTVNLIVGAIYGAIEGYYGGKIDLFMERFVEILSAVPFMIVISLLRYHMEGTSPILIVFIAFFLTGWIGMAGRTRMQFYRFKNQEYVLAARTLGASDARIMFKHIFPNSLGTLITSSVLIIPSTIFSESSLSYLGIINLDTGDITSVGSLLAGAQAYLTSYPHMMVFPALFICLLMLSFNLFGNGLRDAFNPSLRGSED